MRGVWTALITPFNDKNEIDIPAFVRILHDQAAAKVTGVIPCGSTGEAVTLSKEEKKVLIRTAIQELKGTGVKVAPGTGTNNTVETLELSSWAAEQGADALLIVTPYYNKPSQVGLENHFRAVADAVSCEIILYNVPGRTGIQIAPETVAKLATHPKIKTLKESSGNVQFANEIIDTLSSNHIPMDILCGDDALFLPFMSIGAKGVVSVASNLIPRAMVGIQQAMENGKLSEAQKIHQRYYPLFRDLFVESNPVPVKYAMSFAGWCNSRVRSPLAPLSTQSLEKLKSCLNKCEIEPGKLA